MAICAGGLNHVTHTTEAWTSRLALGSTSGSTCSGRPVHCDLLPSSERRQGVGPETRPRCPVGAYSVRGLLGLSSAPAAAQPVFGDVRVPPSTAKKKGFRLPREDGVRKPLTEKNSIRAGGEFQAKMLTDRRNARYADFRSSAPRAAAPAARPPGRRRSHRPSKRPRRLSPCHYLGQRFSDRAMRSAGPLFLFAHTTAPRTRQPRKRPRRTGSVERGLWCSTRPGSSEPSGSQRVTPSSRSGRSIYRRNGAEDRRVARWGLPCGLPAPA